ncbi:MAG: hypothetical protein ISS52_08505 [Dehalococcoidia bacterium]|nr:hypothetical protein [Dehalococcoidia bacterium]
MKRLFAREFWQYIIDSSSLINIEQTKGIKALEQRRGALLISERIAFEVAYHPEIRKTDRLRQFVLRNPEVITPFKDNEEKEYLQILRQPGIDPGEASAMAIALKRKLPLVIDERDTKATGKAKNHGIHTLSWHEFLIKC